MKKLIIFLSTFLFAYNNLSIVPYIGFLTYHDSIKNKAGVYGGYISFFLSPMKYEVDLEHLKLEYKNNTRISDYNQNDITFLVKRYVGYNFIFTGGVHNIFVKQKYNSNKYDRIYILGAMYYKYLKYNVGVDFYKGDYDNRLNVYQLTPYFGINFGNYYSNIGSFYLDTKINLIKLNKKNVANKTFYKSLDISLNHYHKSGIYTTLSGVFFKNVYRVTTGGFVVYNLKEEYIRILKLAISYNLTSVSNFKLSYSRALFRENDNIAGANVFVAIYAKSF